MKRNNSYRVTRIAKNGKRLMKMVSESELQKLRARRLQEIRKNELEMTQKDLAQAVGVKLRTLQDWESGRSPMPKPVEILMNLMKKMPKVKKQLMAEAM